MNARGNPLLNPASFIDDLLEATGAGVGPPPLIESIPQLSTAAAVIPYQPAPDRPPKPQPALRHPPAYNGNTPARQRNRERRINADLDRINNQFIESLGELGELKAALAQCENPKAQNFLVELMNPKTRKWTVSSLAYKCGISPAFLADIWRKYNLAKGMLTVISGIPVVAKDIVEDAKSTKQVCGRCDGFGEIFTEIKARGEGRGGEGDREQLTQLIETIRVPCPQCEGGGFLRKPGDSGARKLMFETAGLIKAPGGVNVNVNVNHSVESILDEFEEATSSAPNSAASSAAGFARSAVIDVTPTP